MKPRTVELLIYAKAIYYRGEVECLPDTNVSNMVAVMNFHDALEFCVRAVIEEEAITHNSGDTLLPLIKAVDKHFKDASNAKSLPFASQVNGLNTTRNNAKHHATPPVSSATSNARVHTLAFLESVCNDYFGVTLDTISQASVIREEGVRLLLQKAERQIAADQFLPALINIKKAFQKAKPSEKSYYDPFHSRHFPHSPLPSTSSRMMNDLHSNDIHALGKAIGETTSQINDLQSQLQEVKDLLALVMMGVDVTRLERFMATTPHIIPQWRGSYEFLWDKNITATREMAMEALQFALEMSVKWEHLGVLGRRPNPFSSAQRGGSWEVIETRENDIE